MPSGIVGALRPQQTDYSSCAKRKQDPDFDASGAVPVRDAERALVDLLAA